MSATQRRPIIAALDAEPLGRDGSGNDRYLAGIVDGLLALDSPNVHLALVTPDVNRVAHLVDADISVIHTRPGLAGQVSWARDARAAGADIAIGNYLPPIGFAGPRVTIFHDVAWRRIPSAFPRLMVPRLDVTARLALRLSDVVVTSSRFTYDEMKHFYPRARGARFVVVPGAASGRFTPSSVGPSSDVLERLRLPKEFALAVGNLHPRKNLHLAIAACREAEVPLVIAGQPIWGSTMGDDDKWTRWVGRVTDEELSHLYRECIGLVYPSLYEGFGLPLVEAMASGAPVLCSNRGSLPEVAGDAAVYFDPYDRAALVSALRRLVSDREWRAGLRAKSIRRSHQFSWRSSAGALIAVLEELASAP